MKIKRNERYKEQLIELQALKDKYSSDYKAVSEAYWPVYDQLKKRVKDRTFLIGVCICILVVLTFTVIFGGIKNEYLLGGSYVISGGLLALAIIRFIKLNKIVKEFNQEFQARNKEIENLQEQIRTLYDDMVEEMMMIICYNTYHYDDDEVDINEWDENYSKLREKVLEETANSLAYEDVVSVYNRWVEDF